MARMPLVMARSPPASSPTTSLPAGLAGRAASPLSNSGSGSSSDFGSFSGDSVPRDVAGSSFFFSSPSLPFFFLSFLGFPHFLASFLNFLEFPDFLSSVIFLPPHFRPSFPCSCPLFPLLP